MAARRVTVRVTHEFRADPQGVRRGYDTWVLLLARQLDLAPQRPAGVQSPELARRTMRVRRKRKGTA